MARYKFNVFQYLLQLFLPLSSKSCEICQHPHFSLVLLEDLYSIATPWSPNACVALQALTGTWV